MLNALIKERIKKLKKLETLGIDVYPARVKRTHLAEEVIKNFAAFKKTRKKVTVAGRLMALRVQGGLIFSDLKDKSGKIQLVVKKDKLKNFKIFRNNLDIGDFVEAGGAAFKTKKGEKSIAVKNLRIIVKSLRPMPAKWHGLADVETRLRKRYLDLLANKETKELFVKKSVFWKTVRDFLEREGFLEVQTPALENIPGGADAEPFKTHHDALGRDFYLRISLELPLKKLLAGGYEKVFEIGRVFRNEGIDKEHLQEYDMMEFYWAYADYEQGMQLTEKLYKEIVKQVTGGYATGFEKTKINWNKKWPKIDYFTAFRKETGIDLDKTSISELRKKADKLKIGYKKIYGKGRMVDLIYKKTVRQKLIQPCFLVGHPIEISPLAKRDPNSPAKALRFQIVAAKTELGNGFGELNDPVEQKKRFQEQMRLRQAGDKEAQMTDKDFVEAMEYGMPPAVGFGMSERLFAVLMNKPVRETVIFPPMRSRSNR